MVAWRLHLFNVDDGILNKRQILTSEDGFFKVFNSTFVCFPQATLSLINFTNFCSFSWDAPNQNLI
jgi:hypothetical protein